MVEKIEEIVREASRLMLTDHFRVDSKGGSENLVTSSDYAVQEYLCSKLSELVPGSSFLCEEEGMQDYGDHEYVWIIDPIDGTMNYTRGIRECAISVALKKDGELFAAVVYSPAAGEMFTAEKGKGARYNGNTIHISDRKFRDALFCTAWSTYRKEWAPVCMDIINDVYYRINDIRRFGVASLELCYLACGRCELYFEYRLQPWDIAAGSLILQEAGGILRTLHGKPLTYKCPELVIGANSEENFAELSSTIDRYIEETAY